MLQFFDGTPVAGASIEMKSFLWPADNAPKVPLRTFNVITGSLGSVNFFIPLDSPLLNAPGRHRLEGTVTIPTSLHDNSEAATAGLAYTI